MVKFNNIYVEEQAYEYPHTQKILDKLKSSNVITINHYKDVFCRPRQNVNLQKQLQNLILAVKQDDYVYKGAKVCQDFGFDNFHYCSCVMNCICNCEYCYLKGMYPSGHLVVFVNLNDYFNYLQDKNLYICASYDTDLFPLEPLLGYVKKWCKFASDNPQSKIEIRTKFKNLDIWKANAPDNMIFAFSLSPQNIIDKYEHKTSNLAARLENICSAIDTGHCVRLCFDPIIYCKDWKIKYSQLIDKCFSVINANKVLDISVGSFRISQTYLKNMRKNDCLSAIVNFPFTNIKGYYQYTPNLQSQMENFVVDKISEHFDKNKVFLWK